MSWSSHKQGETGKEPMQ